MPECSYQWIAEGNTSGLSLDNATSSSPTLSGIPMKEGVISLVCTAIDPQGNTSSNTSMIFVCAPYLDQ